MSRLLSALRFKSVSALPIPAGGDMTLGFKSDNKLYKRDSSGTETLLEGGASSGPSVDNMFTQDVLNGSFSVSSSATSNTPASMSRTVAVPSSTSTYQVTVELDAEVNQGTIWAVDLLVDGVVYGNSATINTSSGRTVFSRTWRVTSQTVANHTIGVRVRWGAGGTATIYTGTSSLNIDASFAYTALPATSGFAFNVAGPHPSPNPGATTGTAFVTPAGNLRMLVSTSMYVGSNVGMSVEIWIDGVYRTVMYHNASTSVNIREAVTPRAIQINGITAGTHYIYFRMASGVTDASDYASVLGWVEPTGPGAAVADSGWLNAPGTQISAYGSPFQAPKMRKLNDEVILTGLSKYVGGTTGSAVQIAVLPVNWRPNGQHIFNVMGGANVGTRIDVQADGQVVLATGGSTNMYVSLDGIRFFTGIPVT